MMSLYYVSNPQYCCCCHYLSPPQCLGSWQGTLLQLLPPPAAVAVVVSVHCVNAIETAPAVTPL